MMHITIFNPSFELVKKEIALSINIKNKNRRKDVLSILRSILN